MGMLNHMLTLSVSVAALALFVTPLVPLAQGTPQTAVEALLAADRAFAAASAKTDLVSGLSALFADSILMPLPGGRFAEGRAAAIAALRDNPDNVKARVDWTPVRGGISADGQHGFTFGQMTVHRDGGTQEPAKYLAYWVQEPAGWRVVAYKRTRDAAGTKATPMAPSVPQRMVAPTSDAAAIAAHRDSLAAVEQAFSDDAQKRGLGPAFETFGREDAMNLGGPKTPGFVIGAREIGKLVGQGEPAAASSVSWAADKAVIVASSGDLGVNFGFIRRNTPPSDPKQPSSFAFFTIWRRDTPTAPWRYIAE
jgi:ketosteroid isomerase-like protein